MANQVSFELVLLDQGTLINWIRKYKEDGYNIINRKKGMTAQAEQRQTDSRTSKTNKGPKTEEFKAYCRERVHKKIGCLSFPKNQEPKSEEIATMDGCS